MNEENENGVAYFKSRLMYLHITALVGSLFIDSSLFMILFMLFGFGFVAYEAQKVGWAYFISFGVPLLALFILFIMCVNMKF